MLMDTVRMVEKYITGVGYYGDFGVNGGGFGDIDIGIDSDY
jgi:hypothetical protein